MAGDGEWGGGGVEYIGETKTHQLNTKKTALQENGKRRVKMNTPRIVMGGLIGCTQKCLQNYPTYTNVKLENR